MITELSNGEEHFIYLNEDAKKKAQDERSDLWDKFKDVQGTTQGDITGYLLEKIFLSLERDLTQLKEVENSCRDLWKEMFLHLHKTNRKLSEESSGWNELCSLE